MDLLFIILSLVGMGCMAFLPETLETGYDLKKIQSVLTPGSILRFYTKTSNVFDSLSLQSEYEVMQMKGWYVRMVNLKSGKVVEENLELSYKYTDRCEVYHGDDLVCVFGKFDVKLYGVEKPKLIELPWKKKKVNCI